MLCLEITEKEGGALHKSDLEKLFQDNPFKSLADAIYEVLLNEIIEFQLLPESKINETHLAEYLNVSRTPLRKALDLLEQEGHVKKIYNKGTFVSALDVDDYFDIIDFRYMIEPMAAGYAAQRITEKQLRQLLFYTQEVERAYSAKDNRALLEAEDNFHRYIILCSKNKYLINAYDAVDAKLKKYRMYVIADKKLHNYLVGVHRLIYNAVSFKDREVAEAAARRHITLLKAPLETDIELNAKKMIRAKLDIIRHLK